MHRRAFTRTAFAALCAPAIAVPVAAQNTFRRLRPFETRMSGETFRYSRKTVKDFTGSAPEAKIERFEVRGTDCRRRSECSNPRLLNGRMVARNRSERVLGYRVGDGTEGLFRYSVYLPSRDYTIVDSVGSTFGQLLWAFDGLGGYDSFPICSLDSARDTRGRVEFVSAEMRDTEGQKYRSQSDPVGSLYDGMLDRWLNIQVLFKVSSGRDGYIEPRIDGRPVGRRFVGRTALSKGWLEVRYGVYQTGTNQFSGDPSEMPTQVACFSRVEMLVPA